MEDPRPIDYPAAGKVRTGWLWQRPGRGARPVIVVVHGLLVSSRLPEIRIVCRALAESYDVVAIDLRGHGDAPGLFTWGLREPADLADLISFLHGLHPAVGVLGFSIGGAIAIQSAVEARQREDPAGPEAICTVGAPAHLDVWRFRIRPVALARNLGLILRRRQRWIRPGWFRPSACRPLDRVAGVSPVPLLLIHGEADWLIHPSHARRLREAAGPTSRLVMIPGGTHAEFIVAQDPAWLLDPVRRFFDETLTEAGPGARPGEAQPEVRINPGRS